MAGALSAGSYTVTVTDANGCTETQSVTVLEPTVLTSTVSSMDALCNGSSDGSATVSSAGGTAPYTYLWNDGQTTAMAGALSAGSYTVIVTDANGCTENQSAMVLEPTPILVTSTSQDSVSCYGLSDGLASIAAFGGTGSIMYMWDSTAGSQNTDTATNLTQGIYLVSMTDANGCYEDTTVTVLEPQPLIFTNVTSDSISCYGGADGFASASAIGGTGSIMYMWDSTAGNQTTDTATNLSAGIYNLSVMDANGCLDDTTITVGEPNLITGSELLQVCDSLVWNGNLLSSSGIYVDTLQSINGCDSVATLDLTVSDLLFSIDTSQQNLVANVSGGTAPYSYEWSTGDTSDVITPSANGQYWLIVYDADLCSGDTVFYDVTYLPNVGIVDNGHQMIINIYPNPTLGNITIDLVKQQTELQVTLYDMYGKLVYINNYQDSKLIELNLDAPPGIYYLDINFGRRYSRHKIIMQ